MSVALSIHAPWAWAILHAGKDVENRSWFPPKKLIGERFWIHVSKWGTKDELCDEFYFVRDCIERSGVSFASLPPVSVSGLEAMKGQVVGSVRLKGQVTRTGAPAFVSPWFFGPVGFVLAEPQALETPVSLKGRLGFFPVEIR